MRYLGILVLLSACSALAGKDDAGAGADASAADATTSEVHVDAPTFAVTCALLGNDCGANHACYPYPFDSEHPTGTLCGSQGTGTEQHFCASQLDCDGQSVCSDPGAGDATCLIRCDPQFPFCAVGQNCSTLPSYPGVGVCLSI